jgi:WXXGXW repeat (2 copies)
MRRQLLSAAFVALSGVLAACGGGGYGYAYVSEGPPPPVAVGVVGAAPGPGYVWVEGYHVYQGGRYVWTPGRWERPPHAGAKWVKPEWRHEGKGWRFHEGHWK